jgi:hypothetical protein
VRRFALAACAVAMAWTPATFISAQPATSNDACSAPYTEYQRLRKQGKLRAAREALLRCVAPSCPGFIQTDCAAWLVEVDAQMPTVLFAAVGPDGRDTANVTVTDGGTILATTLDGRAVPLDPGQHELEFSYPGAPPIRQTILVREGEKSRRVDISFAAAAPVASAVPQPPASSAGALGGLAIGGFVTAGLGLGALAAFAGIGITGQAEFDELYETCGAGAPAPDTSTCTDAQIDPVQTKLTIADAMLGVGVGLVAIGVTLVVIDVATDAPNETAATLEIGPTSARAVVRF